MCGALLLVVYSHTPLHILAEGVTAFPDGVGGQVIPIRCMSDPDFLQVGPALLAASCTGSIASLSYIIVSTPSVPVQPVALFALVDKRTDGGREVYKRGWSSLLTACRACT